MSRSVNASRIVLAARPDGPPVTSDFRLEPAALRQLADGEVLVGTSFLSLDPYMRGRMNAGQSYASGLAIGDTMVGESVARVLESRGTEYDVGDVVLAPTGWATHAVLHAAALTRVEPGPLPLTTRLGILGMPGFTAYAGMAEIGRPKAGETVVVAAASGPVGSLVGQLAKRAGARAVGIAGGAEKCAFVRDELGFDDVVDHHSPDLPQMLQRACPDGIDIYFENVGGDVWSAVQPLLNRLARIPVCGLIADYNGTTAARTEDQRPALMRAILSKSLTLRGFINSDLVAHRQTFLTDVSAGLLDGSLRYREDVTDGLENAPRAFLDMLLGRNFGKAIVRVGG